MSAPLNNPRTPPYKVAGLVLTVLTVAILVLVYLLFDGAFIPKTKLTMIADRSGLSMDKGGKGTYNGVEVGRVTEVTEITEGNEPKPKFLLDVNPDYIHLIPANVDANIKATTVFGNKYVSFTSPKKPVQQRISPKDT